MKAASANAPALDLRTYDEESYGVVVPTVERLYGEIYQEPPYCEGPEDVADFVAGMPRRAAQPMFRLTLAVLERQPAGFGFGHQLVPETKWWQGATEPIDDAVTREYPNRTFAIIELAVLPEFRRRGIARALHDSLLSGHSEERATLLVRPEAKAARAAYESWGYTRVGSIRPWPTAPVYNAMVLDLRSGE